MSIEKTISPHLQELIDTTNNSIQTLKSQILEIYEAAKLEGFTPQEARILIEEKVVKVSDRYIRLVLPDEAKDTKKANKELESDAEVVPHTSPPATIPSNYEIKDAESTEITKEDDLPEPPPHRQQQEQEEIVRLRHQIEDLTVENTQLRIQKIGTLANKFDFEYDFEMPSGSIVPFIVTCFPDKKDGYIRLNKEKVAAIERKEARNKK